MKYYIITMKNLEHLKNVIKIAMFQDRKKRFETLPKDKSYLAHVYGM